MNYLFLQVLFIGLIFVTLPLNAENEHVEKGTEIDRDGSEKLTDKRYRLHGKRGSDDTSNELSELEKRYRLMGKRYRLLGKRGGYEVESDENYDNESVESLQKRYRLSGNNVGGKRFKVNKKYRYHF
jgi:hypothetical protein